MPKQNRQPGIHLHKTKYPNKLTGKLEYYWILISKNGRTIAKSSETYKRKGSAVRSISIAAKIFAASDGLLGGRYYDHSGKDGVDIINYDYK